MSGKLKLNIWNGSLPSFIQIAISLDGALNFKILLFENKIISIV
jgi:hypothetical protein